MNTPEFSWDEQNETYEEFLSRLPKEQADMLLDGHAALASPKDGLRKMLEIADFDGTNEERSKMLDERMAGFDHADLMQEIADIGAAGQALMHYHQSLDALHMTMHLQKMVDSDPFQQFMKDVVEPLLDGLMEDRKEPWQEGGEDEQ